MITTLEKKIYPAANGEYTRITVGLLYNSNGKYYYISISPEKVLEEEQKDGNDVIFEIVSSNPFECEYRRYVRKPNWDVKIQEVTR